MPLRAHVQHLVCDSSSAAGSLWGSDTQDYLCTPAELTGRTACFASGLMALSSIPRLRHSPRAFPPTFGVTTPSVHKGVTYSVGTLIRPVFHSRVPPRKEVLISEAYLNVLHFT